MTLKHILFFIFCITLVACNVEPVDLPLDDPINIDNPDDDSDDDDDDNDDDDDSNNDDESDDETILIKRIVETYSEDEVYTTNYSYDGNKLLQVEYDGGTKNVYTYEGDLLVRNDQYLNDELEAIIVLEYDSNDVLIMFTEAWLDAPWTEDLIYRHDITYNTDNTLTDNRYRSDSGSEFKLDRTEHYTYIGNNIMKIENDQDNYKLLFDYDDKNGIHKNIHAIEILNLTSGTEFGGYIQGNANNVIRFVESDEDVNVFHEFTYTYIYNDKNYPENAEIFYEGELDSKIEYFYE